MPILTDTRWELACQARAAGKGVRASYLEGGFTGKPAAATKFFQRPDILARIAEIQTDRYAVERKGTEIAAKKLSVNAAWVLERLMWNAERCLRGKPIMGADGRHTGEYSGKPDAAGANRALELIGQHLGMFITRHEVGQPGDFQRMSDEELDKFLMGQGKAIGLPSQALQALEKLLALPKPDVTQ